MGNNTVRQGLTPYSLYDHSSEEVMAAGVAAGDRISERLQESLARLRKDIDRVEVWAGALEGFSRPIPEYDPARGYELTPTDGVARVPSDPKDRS
jgi:hypothetical protein